MYAPQRPIDTPPGRRAWDGFSFFLLVFPSAMYEPQHPIDTLPGRRAYILKCTRGRLGGCRSGSMHTRTHTHAETYTYTYRYIYTHTYTYTYTTSLSTRKHTSTQTHKHTHTTHASRPRADTCILDPQPYSRQTRSQCTISRCPADCTRLRGGTACCGCDPGTLTSHAEELELLLPPGRGRAWSAKTCIQLHELRPCPCARARWAPVPDEGWSRVGCACEHGQSVGLAGAGAR